jgi:hypothetical protein
MVTPPRQFLPDCPSARTISELSKIEKQRLLKLIRWMPFFIYSPEATLVTFSELLVHPQQH